MGTLDVDLDIDLEFSKLISFFDYKTQKSIKFYF